MSTTTRTLVALGFLASPLLTSACATTRSVQLRATHTGPAQDTAGGGNDEELAKQLANPVSTLLSVPFQFDFDHDIGPATNGDRFLVNVQPLLPFPVDDVWNLISRTELPITFEQDDIFPGAGDQSGLGDIVQSFFLSPREPTASGVIWGAGPVLLLPTAKEDLLGADQWGLGPTAVGLKQEGPWTYGALGKHIWGLRERGDDDRRNVNVTSVKPFVAYTMPKAWTYTADLDTSYDWRGEDWAVPLNVVATKVVRLGDLPVQMGGGLRYWAEHADDGPEGYGLRFVITPVFPK